MVNKPFNAGLYSALEQLINSNESKKEHECREYLQYVDSLLTNASAVVKLYNRTEYRGNKGDTDYIISANIKDEGGFDCVQAYIWELKAPQCYVFEKDTNERLIPTYDLISAENQLINYHYELKFDAAFRKKVKVLHPENVKIGGIIIGCKSTIVKGECSEDKKVLYEEASFIRKNYFYKHEGIRLLIWDTVLHQFKSETHISEVFNGDLEEPISAIMQDF